MSVAVYILILWVLHPISVIRSLLSRFRKDIPVFNVDETNWLKDWRKIRIFGLIASVSLIMYIVIILVFGWTFRSYYGLLILQVILFLIIDRYLISVNYGKTFWIQKSALNYNKFILTKITSYLYIIGRLTYIFYCLYLTPVLFVAQTGFTIDTFVYGIYGEIVNDSNLLKKHTPFGIEINYANGNTDVYSDASYFKGKLIFYWDDSDPQYVYLFMSKLGLFMKYVNPSDNMIYFGVYPDEFEYNDDKSILYLDSDNNDNRNKIEYINGNFYLEYYSKYFHYDSNRRGEIMEAPKRIKL